jgi:hypothetical protein
MRAKHQEFWLSVCFPTHSIKILAAWPRCNTRRRNLVNSVRGTGVLIRGLARMPIDFLMAALRAKELELSAGRSRRAWKVIAASRQERRTQRGVFGGEAARQTQASRSRLHLLEIAQIGGGWSLRVGISMPSRLMKSSVLPIEISALPCNRTRANLQVDPDFG